MAEDADQRSRESKLAIRAVFAGWLLLSLVDGLTAYAGLLNQALSAIQALGAVVLLLLIARGTRAKDCGNSRRERRQALQTTLLWQSAIWLFIGVTFWAQYDALQALSAAPTSQLLLRSYRSYLFINVAMAALALIATPSRISRGVAHLAERPAQLMAAPFAIAACAGGLLLSYPLSLQHIEDANLLDAFFNAISAVCVTGLSPTNVATTYTRFGQGVLLALLQVGGLGIAVLSAFFTVMAGRRMRGQRAAALAELLDVKSFHQLRSMLVGVVVWTLLLEAIGACLLYVSFRTNPDIALSADQTDAAMAGSGGYIWAAVFHSASAFCNAGFSLFRGGTEPLAHMPLASLTLMGLITLGGVGFPVLNELLGNLRKRVMRQRPPKLSLHSRVVLATSALLIAVGTLAFAAVEWRGALASLNPAERLLAAAFQSVSCRTAGFATVSFGAMQPAMLLMACLLMFVGASPGSTGGGTKTTTLAVLLAALRSELRRQPQTTLAGRAISRSAVQKAIAVVFLTGALMFTSILALLIFDHHAPLPLIFEAVSAFTTTGLSTGITGELSAAGKVVLCIAMFVGRIGPLTIAAALTARSTPPRYRLVEERIGIG